jgi:hypothetical protein
LITSLFPRGFGDLTGERHDQLIVTGGTGAVDETNDRDGVAGAGGLNRSCERSEDVLDPT